MPAVRCDVVVEQGATFRIEFTWLGPDGIPVDLTDYTARSQFRAAHGDVDVLLDLSSESDVLADDTYIDLGGPSGLIILHAKPDATRELTATRAVFDVELTAPSGDVYRLAEGRAFITREVTR